MFEESTLFRSRTGGFPTPPSRIRWGRLSANLAKENRTSVWRCKAKTLGSLGIGKICKRNIYAEGCQGCQELVLGIFGSLRDSPGGSMTSADPPDWVEGAPAGEWFQ